jgi:acetyl esterase
MTTRHLIDPEIAPLLELMPSFELNHEVLALVREGAESRFLFLDAPAIAPEIKTIPGPAGPLEIYWYDPAPGTTGRAALYHIHGGGMVLGSAASMQHGPAGMAAALGIPVASVEYRLAPDHPFPAPQEDCLAGLAWLAAHAGELGVDPARIGIIGESAGGGLAAAVAQMARDLGAPRLAAQFLTYPMLDHRTGGEDCPYRNAGTGEFVWSRTSNQFGWQALRGDYPLDDTRIGWFSPIRAESLAGLPPTWIGTGALDLFLDEDLEYARQLASAGVPVELHVYPGAIHAFNAMAEAAVSKAFNRDLLGAVTRLLG